MTFKTGQLENLYDHVTGQPGMKNRVTGKDMAILTDQSTSAPLLNRLTVTSSNTTAKARVGDVLTVVAPAGTVLSSIQGYQDQSSTGGGANTAITGFTGSTYTLTSNEIPPLGAVWPIKVSAVVTNISTDGLAIGNPYTVPLAPTGVALTPISNALSATFTAPTDNGGSAITNYQMSVYRTSDNLLLGQSNNAGSPAVLTGIAAGVSVYCKIAAQNSQGVGPQSAASNLSAIDIVGGDRLYSNEKYQTGASGLKNGVWKTEAEAPFTAIRLWIGTKTTSGTQATYQAYVAATEEGRVDNIMHQFAPTSGGVVNDSVTNVAGAGFSTVTWGGANSVTPPLVTGQGTGQNLAAYVVSDWIPKTSLPRTDVAGGRPMAIFRVSQTVAGAAYPSGILLNQTNWHLGRGQPWYRENCANAPTSSATNSYPTFSADLADPMYCWIEFQYAVPCRNVLVCGDSREASAACLYDSDSWNRRALKGLSSQYAPITVTNASGSGHSETQFLAIAMNILQAGWVGTDVLLPGFSQNGFNQGDGGASYIAAINTFVTYCLSQNLRVLMTTDYGISYNGAAEVARQNCIANVKALAAQGKVTLVDTDAVITDYTLSSPAMKAIYNTSGLAGVEGVPGSGDNIHCGPTGQITQMAPTLAKVF